MSLYQYGLYFILCFILFIIFIQVFISCLSYLSKNAFIVIGIVGAIFMIEILLYHNISDDSYLVCLKEWNLWMFLLNIPLFQNFRTVKMLNHCDLYIAITIFIVIVIVGLYFLSYYTFKNGKTMISIKLPILKNSHIYSLGIYEGYKIFWKQGVLILMIMYGWFTLYNMSGFKPFIDTNTYYYRTYAKQIESLNDEKKEEYVMQQNDNYEDLHRQLNDLNMMQQQGEISDAKFEIEVYPIKKALYSEPGWQQAYKQYLWTKDNNKVFVEEYGYQYLLEHLKVDGILWLGLSWFVLAIALHNVMAIENKGDVKVLLELSKYKTKRIDLWKYLYSILITIFAYVFGLGLYLMFVSNYFDLSMFQAPLSSLSFLNMDGKLSIGMFLILVIAISFILTLLYTFVCLLFSKKCKTSGQSLISCLILACVTLVCLIITLV